MREWSLIALSVVAVTVLGCGAPLNSPGGVALDSPGAVALDPQHYSVSFENDIIRVLDVRYGPGEASVMHRHPANCAVFVTDVSATFTFPGGEVVDSSSPAGDVQCGDGGQHLPTNTGTTPFRVVVIELKGRETFAP